MTPQKVLYTCKSRSFKILIYYSGLAQSVEQAPPEADQPLAEAVYQMQKYFVYVLRSFRNGKRYVGCTSKTPEERLTEHNEGTTTFTRQNKPFNLCYFETFGDKTEALKREKFLKSGQGRKFLDSIPA